MVSEEDAQALPLSPTIATAHRWLTRVIMVIVILYATLILWPAYESGLAWFVGDPKGAFEDYHVWYNIDFRPLDFLNIPIFVTAALIMPLTWGLLPFLGMVMLVLVLWNWVELGERERWIGLGATVLAITVPLLTWMSSQQFMHWFAD